MKNAQVKIFFSVIILLVLGSIITFMLQNSNKKPAVPGKYDELATCIKNSGAIFYGTFWCPHCQNTKKEFGDAAKFLPYVECSTPDGNDQNQICKDKKIEGYPTWIFKDGSKIEGEATLDILAQKTSCVLPK